jgi:site-specific recombinase XerD
MIIENRLVRRDLECLIDLRKFIEVDCLIDAKSDLEAVKQWLARFSNEHTVRAYARDATRFLLWMSFIKGKHLDELLLNDIQDYINFLQAPSDEWCMDKKRLKRYDIRWRPFSKPLSKSSIMAAISVLQSLFTFLEEAAYLTKNPVKLIKTSNILGNIQLQKYNVLARMLEDDEWSAVLETIRNLPSNTQLEHQYKAKINLLFSMLYILGLRIEEVANSRWSNFKKMEDRWWFFIQGKGGKLGHIPANDTIMLAVNNYRDIYKLNKSSTEDDDFIFVSDNGEKLTTRTLYNYVKNIGNLASDLVNDQFKKEKLKAFSPHWVRHLSASHQNKIGMPLNMIRENHRHASINTTQIYMHSEDIQRHSFMQNHSMPIETIKPIKEQNFLLSIKLSKGPLDKLSARKLIRNSIEGHLLTDAQLVEDRENNIIYKLSNNIAKHVLDRIEMLCKVWLFVPSIECSAI